MPINTAPSWNNNVVVVVRDPDSPNEFPERNGQ